MRIQRLFFYFIFLLLSIAVQGKKFEKTIELVAGLAKPPFVIEVGATGMQLDIITQALANEGIGVKFLHMPLGRNISGFQHLHADGVITLLPINQNSSLNMSQPYITYQNVAISLAENNYSINSIADLANRSIIAFQNAKTFLGDEYNTTVSYLLDYREIHDQNQQIEMLFLRRTDVIIIDINIFKYFMKHRKDTLFEKPFTVHYLFDERNYSAGFRSKEIRDKFNLGLKKMKTNGSYQAILDSYLN